MMKLKNRIMSWILSPGAYAVWHALGAPEEWVGASADDSASHTIRHIPTGVQLWVASGGFFLDCHAPFNGAIGLIDRHILWPRARRIRKKLLAKPSKNRALFVRMTQLMDRQP